MSFNPDKLKKLVSKNTATRVGGKGTVRRKAKAVRKTATQDDKKLRTALNKLNLQNIPAIEEVNLFKDDGTVVHFTNPKVQASIPANTYVVSGTPETKKLQDLLPGIINQLAPENLDEIKKMVSQFAPQDKGLPVDDDIPDLVENFEAASKPAAPAKEKKAKAASPKIEPVEEPAEPPKEDKPKKGKKEKAAPKSDEAPAEKPSSPKASPAAKPSSPKASPKAEPAEPPKEDKPKKGGKKEKPAASPAAKAEETPSSPKASPAAKPASPKASPSAKPASPKAEPAAAPEEKKKVGKKTAASPAAKAEDAPAEPAEDKPKKTPKKPAASPAKTEDAPADKPSSPKADPKPAAKEKGKKK